MLDRASGIATSKPPRDAADYNLIRTNDIILEQINLLNRELDQADTEVSYWTDRREAVRISLNALNNASEIINNQRPVAVPTKF